VTVWEVMSRGQQPYGDIASLPELIERVKEGHILQCPAGCPENVYDQLMQPCWALDPSARPGFGALQAVLLNLGVVPHEEDDVKVPEQDRLHFAPVIDPLLLRGPSVQHLAALAPDVYAAGANGAETTISQAVRAVFKPRSEDTVCPRDGKVGCAYVDTLTNGDDAGDSTALLSYTWGYADPPHPGILTDAHCRADRRTLPCAHAHTSMDRFRVFTRYTWAHGCGISSKQRSQTLIPHLGRQYPQIQVCQRAQRTRTVGNPEESGSGADVHLDLCHVYEPVPNFRASGGIRGARGGVCAAGPRNRPGSPDARAVVRLSVHSRALSG
jgi:hypothetical protein